MPMPGPPGGPYPAGPPRPWDGGHPYDPYEQPAGSHPQADEPYADPWGRPEPRGGVSAPQYDEQRAFADEPTQYLPVTPYRQPAEYAQPRAYEPPPEYGRSPGSGRVEPPRASGRGRGALMVTLVVSLAVLLGGAVLTGVYLTSDRGADARVVQPAPPAPTITPGPSASVAGGAPAQPAPTPTASGQSAGNDALTAEVGDCLVNEGSNEAPTMRKVTCAAATFEVLKRIPLTTDKTRCNGVPGYTHNFFFDSSVDADDLVLCLKYRK